MTAPDLIDRARAAPIGEITSGLQLRRAGAEFVGVCPRLRRHRAGRSMLERAAA